MSLNEPCEPKEFEFMYKVHVHMDSTLGGQCILKNHGYGEVSSCCFIIKNTNWPVVCAIVCIALSLLIVFKNIPPGGSLTKEFEFTFSLANSVKNPEKCYNVSD